MRALLPYFILLLGLRAVVVFGALPQEPLAEAPGCEAHDAETVIACGGRLPLWNITRADLSSVPKLNDKMVEKLLKNRGEILAAAWNCQSGEEYMAFAVIPGVGPKKARELARFIDPLTPLRGQQRETSQ